MSTVGGHYQINPNDIKEVKCQTTSCGNNVGCYCTAIPVLIGTSCKLRK